MHTLILSLLICLTTALSPHTATSSPAQKNKAALPTTTGKVITIYDTKNTKKKLGTITALKIKYGVLFIPDLKGLTPGAHGFHIHAMPNCADGGMAAGGHYDPKKTNLHAGPYDDDGHLGDLPVLIVDPDGRATIPVLAPRIELVDVAGHSLMIHAGSDNYADHPRPMGGGGERVACGIATLLL